MNRACGFVAALALLAACNKGDSTAPLTGFVQGTVKDTANAAMDQVSVHLRASGSAVDLQTALTDGTGAYSFPPVAPGAYDVFLTPPAATAVVGGNPKSVSVASSLAQADFSLTLTAVSFAGHVQPVFNGYCIGCHSTAGGAPMGLKLTLDSAYALTVGHSATETAVVPRIKASFPDSSYLIHKIQGTHLAPAIGGSGTQMPQGASPLPNQTIRMMRRWVAAGALNN
jgi:carboxypeptidase family protein